MKASAGNAVVRLERRALFKVFFFTEVNTL